jgi:predicted SnoaL-like aldol condensation-catalyzing enzyme
MIVTLIVSAAWYGGAAAAAERVGAAQLEKNKQLVLALTQAMADKDVDLASSYLADGYVQHNPMVPTGKAGFVGFFSKVWQGQKQAVHPLENPPVEIIAEGDLVMAIFKHATPDPVDPSQSYESFSFDAYRVTNGKVSEHWDNFLRRAPAPSK